MLLLSIYVEPVSAIFEWGKWEGWDDLYIVSAPEAVFDTGTFIVGLNPLKKGVICVLFNSDC